MIGQLCGKYRLIESIGRGEVGELFRAEHDLTGELVAVKIFAERVGRDEAVLESVFNDARAVTRLKHAAIVRVLDYGPGDNGALYVAMELLEGESLHARISREGRVPMAKSLALAGNIAGALEAAHGIGVSHGDLKPSSVFIIADPTSAVGERAMVLDFGISRLLGRGATGEDELGTAGFMAPERCRGNEVGPPADIYALGCILFRMLAGQPAINGSRAGGFTVAHINQTPPMLSELVGEAPVTLSELVASLLAKEPGDRPDTPAVVGKLVRVNDLVSALVTAAAAEADAAAELGEAATAIAPALYADDEATVLDSGFLKQALAKGSLAAPTNETADTLDPDAAAAPDDDDDGRPTIDSPTVSPDALEGRPTSTADPIDEDIEVEDLPAPAPRLSPLEESPTVELGASAIDVLGLPAPLRKSEASDDGEIEGLPAPAPASRQVNLPVPVSAARAELPAPLPSVRTGKTPPPEPLEEPLTEDDMVEVTDPVASVLGLPAPVTFRKPTPPPPGPGGGGELARLGDGDDPAPTAPSGGELARLGDGEEAPGVSPGALAMAGSASPRTKPPGAQKAASKADSGRKGKGSKAPRKPPARPRVPSDPILASMIEDSAMGDDAPTMIVPAAIDLRALDKDDDDDGEEVRRPIRIPSNPGGTSLPPFEDERRVPQLPAEWIKWGSIGGGVLLVLIIFLIARSCDDGSTATDPTDDPVDVPAERADAGPS